MSFKVKALFAYSSEHDDDLSFPDGQIITVTEEEDDDWYTGEYTDEASGKHHSGLFPRNFVERYEPVAPPRPARRPQAAAPVPEPAPVVEPETEPEHEVRKVPEPRSPVTQTKSPDPVAPESDADEEEEEEEEEEETDEPAPPPALATKPPPPPREEPRAVPAPAPRAVPPPVAPAATKPPPPPAAPAAESSKADASDRPIGSFKDRIAAFNRGGAAPVAPPKPGGLSGGSGSSGFVKKSYVAPPPSRNAYVPPSTQAPIARLYKREEDPEIRIQDEGDRAPPPPPPERAEEPEEDQPKPMSLKERMAMLQKQQLEQQARHADAASKKAKPKPPPKKTSSSSQPPVPGAAPEAGAEAAEPPVPTRMLSEDSLKAEPVQSPEHEVAELSAAHDDATESIPKAVAPPPIPSESRPQESAATAEDADVETAADETGEEEEVEGEEDEEMDPEIRRRMEIRERMAKMSGGMGMGAMFGGGPGLPGMGARKPPKPRTTESSMEHEEAESSSPPAQPVPIMPGLAMPGMALPGMGLPRHKKQEFTEEPEVEKEEESESEPISAKPASAVVDVEDLKEQPVDDDERETEPERVVPPPPETRQAPPVPPTTERSKRQSLASSGSAAAERASIVPPVPQRAPDHSAERSAPPPPPPQVASPPLPPTSPPRRSMDTKRMSQGPDAGAYARAPPPPPPSQPPRQSLEASRVEESDEEDEESEEEVDQPKGRTSEELHHAGLPSLGPGSQTRAPPPPPPAQSSAPRGVPPPPPSQPPRQSRELPRAPPPVPPPAVSPPEDDDYDPYNYQSNPLGAPAATTSSANTPRVQVSHDDLYDASPPTSPSVRAPPPIPVQAPPVQAAPPVPPPSQPPPMQAAPPPPPPTQPAPSQMPPQAPPQLPPPQLPPQSPIQAPPTMPPVVPQESRKSLDVLGRSSTRRSIDVPRPSGESNEYIASEVDLGRDSNWWAHRRSPPPVFQNRSDVSIEYDESTTVQNDGKAITAKHVYVLFMDYSQTIATAFFSQDNPAGGVEFQQRHEPPPARLRQDQLEAAHSQFGAKIAQAAKGKENHAVADGSPLGFVSELVKAVPGALAPVGNRAFGALVYANMANATVQVHDEIRTGDVLTFRNAKLQGHRGGLKQKYSIDLPSHVAIVLDWDGTKQKVRVYEQNGKKVKVESYKLIDLKTGEAKIWRVVSREWVGWGTTG